ncbi:hypothetical protein [Streptomyces cinerochromogenes]|uniref:hypothetical protein n=1 Tax=Streptomyces cinerochromogenes TaxID=66422 RepID=UPI0016704579|nr:hypothetical protein [Streptomyces cinerochromogenes]GGS74576.1 hypothetical protein GCM10010206_41250 [Streptomyces cinerochromogenes]
MTCTDTHSEGECQWWGADWPVSDDGDDSHDGQDGCDSHDDYDDYLDNGVRR